MGLVLENLGKVFLAALWFGAFAVGAALGVCIGIVYVVCWIVSLPIAYLRERLR